jgi:hypothetical protein
MKLLNKFFIGIVVLLCISATTQAQNLTIDLSSPGKGTGSGTVRISDPSTAGNKKGTGLTYADIDGSPYWTDNWNAAYLYYKNGNIYKLAKAKLNLYATEVLYVNSQEVELVAETNMVDKVVFIDKADTTKTLGVFVVLPDFIENKGSAFCKVFNSGALQLILMEKILVKVSPFDPLTGKNSTNFLNKNNYAIYNSGKITAIKGIDRTSVLSAIPYDATVENWLKENKNKLKSEADVVNLLNYYNGMHK